jgi:hypothetical protein
MLIIPSVKCTSDHSLDSLKPESSFLTENTPISITESAWLMLVREVITIYCGGPYETNTLCVQKCRDL